VKKRAQNTEVILPAYRGEACLIGLGDRPVLSTRRHTAVVVWDDPAMVFIRRLVAIFGGGLLGWSLAGAYQQSRLNPFGGDAVIIAGIGAGLGLGLLVAACIPGEKS